jgi:hypothetical protein
MLAGRDLGDDRERSIKFGHLENRLHPRAKTFALLVAAAPPFGNRHPPHRFVV